VEAVSFIIFDSSITLLSVTITESTGTVCAYETELQLGKQFGDNFQGRSDSVFGDNYRVYRDYRVNKDYYRVNKDCARIENQSSAWEPVLSTIYKAAATLFSVTLTESTGNVRRDKSRHQLGKQFW